MTVLLRRFYATLLLLVCATSLFAQSSALRLATTATVQPRWTALANHKIYLLTTTATQASGKNVMGILAATNKGLYQSLDTGQTWGNLGLPNDDVYDAVVIGGSIIAATDKGIQTRASVGAAWQTRTYPVSNQGSGSGSTQATVQQRGLPTYSLQTAGGRLFAATTRGVYRSNDGGATWTQTELSSTGTLSGKTVRTLALLGNTLLAAVWNDGIYRSADNGITWTFTDIVPGSTVEKTFRTLSVYGATAYVGSSEGNLYQSQNGTTWTKVVSAGNNGQAGVNARGVEALARYGSTIVGAVYNGIAVSHNNGQTWLLMPIATQDVNTMVILPPKPIVRHSSPQMAAAMPGTKKGGASLQVQTCGGSDCGGGPDVGVGSGGTSSGSSGGGVSGYGLPGCNPLGANLNLTPARAPEQPSGLSVTFSVAVSTTLTDFRVEMASAAAPTTWINVTSSYNQFTGFVNGTAFIPAGFMQTPGTYSIRCFGIREDGTCTGGYVSEAQSFIVDPATPNLGTLSLSPAGAYTGQTTTLQLNGSNFFTNAFVTFYNSSAQPVSFPFALTGNSGSVITVNFTAPASGTYYAEIRNPVGEITYPSARLPFTIAVPPAPMLLSVTLPSSASRLAAGATGVITLNGSSFSTTALDGSAGGATVSVNGQDGLWSVTNRTASSLTVQLPSTLSAGSYSLQVINADGQRSTGTVSVTVVPPLAISSSSPATIYVEDPTTVTLNGTFRAGATVVDAANRSGTPALSVSDNAISFGVNIPGANAPSSYTITLSEPTTYGQSAITRTIPVQFPLPALTSVTPDELDASPASGGVASTITIAGTGFTSRTSVFAGTRDLSSFITSRSATSLTLNFPVGTFPAPEVVQIRAENPGAQVSGTLPLTIKNVAPVLTTIAPQSLVATQDQQITITGSKFFNATVTQVFVGSGANAVALSGATVTPTSITVNVPAARVPDIGTFTVEVRNTFGTDVQSSESQNVRIIHPTPEITSLAPLTIAAFDNAQTLTITGAKFSLTRSRVVWVKNGVETVLTLLPNPTATQLRATIPAALLTELGSVTIRVQNQDALDADGGPSASSPLTIIPPIPVVTSVAPNSATASVNAIPVVVTGSKFVQSGLRLVIRNPQTGLVRNLNSPTFGNATTVSGIIPADIAAMAGNYTLAVVNGANAQGQGGGESATTLPFTILNPAPSIASVAPNPATVYEAFTLDVQGSGFVSGATSVTVDGQNFPPASVTVISPTRLTVNVTAIGTAKTASVSITNPQLSVGASLQGGGTATTTFPVVPPVPMVSGAQGNGGGGTLTRNLAGTLTVTGTGFVAGATVLFAGQALTTTFTNQNTLTATVPAALLPTHGVYTVAVRNPQFSNLGGGTSSPDVGVTVQNPTPTLSTIAPTSVTRGNNASITLTGSDFYDGAVVYLSGASSSTFATTVVGGSTGGSSLTFSIPASSLPVAGSYSVAVKNSDPTPGFSSTKTLTVNNPAPVLTELSVNEAQAYSNDLTVTVTGSGFENGITAYWTPSGGSRQALAAPTGVSAGSCTITIPAALLTQAGAFTITLENAAPSLGASNTLTFTVLDRVPTLTSVAPNPIEALSGNTQITLTGDYFAASANAYWNGVLLTRVGAASRTSLTATVPASRLTLATIAQITVQNPQFSGRGGGTSTPAQDLVIANPAPALTSLSPTFVLAGASTASITLTGTAFMPVSVVEMSVAGGAFTQVPATYQSATRIVLTLPAAQLEQPTILAFRVVSPKVNNLGGGTTVEKTFVVRPPVPVLTSITPSTATLTSAPTTVDVSLKGTGFVTNSTVQIAGVNTTTTYVSATELRISIEIGVGVRPAGTYALRIVNPALDVAGTPQGGGTSGALNFTVLNGLPKLTALAPSTTSASLSTWTLTLTGENFATTSRVNYNGTLVAVGNVDFISPTELRATLPAPPIASTTHTLRVENPPIGGQGGGTSATLTLTIEFPRPQITSLSDYSTSATVNDWTMLIRGQLFAPAATVTLNGATLTSTVVNSTTIRAIIPSAQTRDAAVYTLAVNNPTPGGGSSTATFAVTNPAPSLLSVTPTSVPAGADVTLTFTGTNFATTASVILDGTVIQPTTLLPINVSGTTLLTVNIPGWLISTRSTYTVRVTNPTPGGGLSGARSFVVASSTVASVEFVGVTTAILTTGQADGFYVRFRDAFGNLVDVDRPVVRFINDDGSSTGTIALRRSSLGVSSATTTILTMDGTYTLSVDNIPATLGNTTLVVQTGTDFFTRFENVPQAITAGGTVSTFRLTYKDRYGNFTDRGLGDVTLRSGSAAAGRIYTVPMTRLSTGVYESQPFSYTTTGTYYVRVAGIVLANVSYISSTGTLVDGDAPSFRVLPATPIVEFRSVDMDLSAGGSQPAFVLVIRDEFGNDVPSPDVLTVNYTNATSATNGIRSSTGTITLPLRAGRINVYDAPVTRFEWQGAYTMDIAGYSLYKGNRQFVVRPGTMLAEFVGVPSGIFLSTLNTGLPAFTLLIRDRFGNLMDALRTLTYTKSGTPSASGTIPLTQIGLGTYQAPATTLSLMGTYTLTVSGFSSTYMVGNRVTNVVGTPAISNLSPSVITVSNSDLTFIINGTNFSATSEVWFVNYIQIPSRYISTTQLEVTFPALYAQYAFTAPISVKNRAGTDSVSTSDAFLQLLSLPASRYYMRGYNSSIIAGSLQSNFSVDYTDIFGNPTDYQGVVQFSNTDGSSTGTISLAPFYTGTSTATSTRFMTPGTYTLSVAGLTSGSNQNTFIVEAPPPTLKVVFGYTPRALAAAGGTASDIQTLITNALTAGDSVLISIGSSTRLSAAAITPVNYSELSPSPYLDIDLDNLMDSQHPDLGTLHTLRAQNNASVVVLVTDTPGKPYTGNSRASSAPIFAIAEYDNLVYYSRLLAFISQYVSGLTIASNASSGNTISSSQLKNASLLTTNPIQNSSQLTHDTETSSKEVLLEQNFPNPFSDITQIQFSLPQTQTVRLIMYDILGRELATLINNSVLSAGKYSLIWQPENHVNGAVFCRLFTDNQVLTKTMIINK